MKTRAPVKATTPKTLAPFLAPAPVKTGAAGDVGIVTLADGPDREAEPVALLDPYDTLLAPAD